MTTFCCARMFVLLFATTIATAENATATQGNASVLHNSSSSGSDHNNTTAAEHGDNNVSSSNSTSHVSNAGNDSNGNVTSSNASSANTSAHGSGSANTTDSHVGGNNSTASADVTSDGSLEAAGVTVKVQGQSGKMTLTLPKGNGTQDVQVTMDALRQLDSQGNTLGQGGSQKHSFNSFATQQFTFSDPQDTTYNRLQVSKVAFESVMVGSSKLKIDTYIFKEPGNFTVGNDTVTVATGSVKFNVELSNWSWCGASGVTCNKNGEGAFVELDITVKGEGDASGSGKNVDLGDAKLVMLNTYSEDDGLTWTEMPAGYPMMNRNTFTIRIPKFSSKVIYDPVVTSSTATDDASSESGESELEHGWPLESTSSNPHFLSADAASAMLPWLSLLITSLWIVQ